MNDVNIQSEWKRVWRSKQSEGRPAVMEWLADKQKWSSPDEKKLCQPLPQCCWCEQSHICTIETVCETYRCGCVRVCVCLCSDTLVLVTVYTPRGCVNMWAHPVHGCHRELKQDGRQTLVLTKVLSFIEQTSWRVSVWKQGGTLSDTMDWKPHLFIDPSLIHTLMSE